MSMFHAGGEDWPRHEGLPVGFSTSRRGTRTPPATFGESDWEQRQPREDACDGSGPSSSRSPSGPPGAARTSRDLARMREGDSRRPSGRHGDGVSSLRAERFTARDSDEGGSRGESSSGRKPGMRTQLGDGGAGDGAAGSASLRSGQAAQSKVDRKVSFHHATRERAASHAFGQDDGEGETCAEAAEHQLQSLNALLGELARAVDEVAEVKRKGADAVRNHQVKVQRLQQEIDTALSALDLELRCIASSLKVAYRSSLLAQRQQKQQEAESLGRSYEDALLSVTCEDLLAYRAGGDQGEEDQESPGGEKMRGLLVQTGDEIQDKTQASLCRTKQMVAETEEMGAHIVETMNEHTEQLRKANEDLDDVQYNVNRAKKTAMAIAKNAAGDRFSQCLCLFIFLFLVISIVLVCVPR